MTTPAGWTLVDSQSTPELSSYIFTKTATATDPGASVTVALDSPAATSLTLSAYRNTPGVSTTTATLHIDTPDHTAPDVTVPADTWVVWFWATTSPSSLSPSDGAIPRADAHAPSGQASASSPDDGAQRAEAGTLAPGSPRTTAPPLSVRSLPSSLTPTAPAPASSPDPPQPPTVPATTPSPGPSPSSP